MAGDVGQRVARDRELAEGAGTRPDQHDRVGAIGAVLAVVVGRPPARHRLDAVLGLRLVGAGEGARAHVGAEDEDRLAAQQERAAVEHVADPVGEFRLLDLGGDPEGEHAERDPADHEDPEPLRDPPPRRALARHRELAWRLGAAVAAVIAAAAQLRSEPGEVGLADAVGEPAARLVDRVVGRLLALWLRRLIPGIGHELSIPHALRRILPLRGGAKRSRAAPPLRRFSA